MPIAHSLKTWDNCGIVLCDKTAHFGVAYKTVCGSNCVKHMKYVPFLYLCLCCIQMCYYVSTVVCMCMCVHKWDGIMVVYCSIHLHWLCVCLCVCHTWVSVCHPGVGAGPQWKEVAEGGADLTSGQPSETQGLHLCSALWCGASRLCREIPGTHTLFVVMASRRTCMK